MVEEGIRKACSLPSLLATKNKGPADLRATANLRISPRMKSPLCYKDTGSSCFPETSYTCPMTGNDCKREDCTR